MGWVMSATGKCYYDHFYVPKKVKQTKDNNMNHITIERFYELLDETDDQHVRLWCTAEKDYIDVLYILKMKSNPPKYMVKVSGGGHDLESVYEEKPLAPLKELDNIINRFVDEMSWDPIHAYKSWKDKYQDQLDKMEVEK